MNKSHQPERACSSVNAPLVLTLVGKSKSKKDDSSYSNPFGSVDVWEGVHKSPSCSVMAGNLSSSRVLPSCGVPQGSGHGSVIFLG